MTRPNSPCQPRQLALFFRLATILFVFLTISLATLAEELPQGVTKLPDGRLAYKGITFDPKRRSLSFPAEVNMRTGVVEYLLVSETGKTHESVLTTKIRPSDLHVVALLLGAKAQSQPDAEPPPKDTPIRGWIEWDLNGRVAKLNFDQAISLIDPSTQKTAEQAIQGTWAYNGSEVTNGQFAADTTGSLIAIFHDPIALVNYQGETKDNDEVHVPNEAALPKVGRPIRVVLRF